MKADINGFLNLYTKKYTPIQTWTASEVRAQE